MELGSDAIAAPSFTPFWNRTAYMLLSIPDFLFNEANMNTSATVSNQRHFNVPSIDPYPVSPSMSLYEHLLA